LLASSFTFVDGGCSTTFTPESSSPPDELVDDVDDVDDDVELDVPGGGDGGVEGAGWPLVDVLELVRGVP
jgi:hypothetical protein